MAKLLNRAIELLGEDRVVNGTRVTVLEENKDGISRAKGTTVPSAIAGFAKGCLFIDTDAGASAKAVYENSGSNTSCTFNLIGDIVASEVVLANGDSFKDANGEEVIAFGDVSSAVNEIIVSNAATGNAPSLAAQGGDTNVAVLLKGKGTGAVQLGQATSVGVTLMADQPIADSSGNELIKFVKTATAVNEVTVTNAAANGAPSLTATGGDTHINLVLSGKGSGALIHRSFVFDAQGAPTAKTVSATLTAVEMAAKIITVNQGAGGASALQLPLATDVDSAFPIVAAGDSFDFSVINTSTMEAEDASITTNTGWTLVGSMDIHAYSAAGSLNSSGLFRARKTGAGAWTLYRLA